MRRSWIILFLILFIAKVGTAQQPSEFAFSHFSTANGLAANLVNFIRQDDKGFIWLATINGLQRYDGNTFLTFRSTPFNKNTIPTDNVPALYFDKRKRLWLTGTNNKVGIFNTNNFTFKEVPVLYKEIHQDYRYKYFVETPDGQFLLYEIRGDIYRFDETRNLFIPDTKTLPMPTGWKPAQIRWDSLIKKYWITSDSGLLLYNPAKRLLSYRGHNAEGDPVIQKYEALTHLLAIQPQTGNRISFVQWLPRESRPLIHHFNTITGEAIINNLQQEMQLDYHELYGFLLQRNKRLWVYGMPLFAQWEPTQKMFIPISRSNLYRDENDINFQRVTASFEDRMSNIWLATDDGVYLFNPDTQIFKTYSLIPQSKEKLIDASVSSVLQMPNGNIFMSTWEKGLFYFDKHFTPISLPTVLQAKQSTAPIWDMQLHSKTGKIWFTLQKGDKAAMVYDPATQKIEWVTDTVFHKLTVRQVTEDKQGNLWFGTQGGRVIKWDYAQAAGNATKGYSLILQTRSNINRLYVGPKGHIWVATAGNGLFTLEGSKNVVVKNFTTTAAHDFQLLKNVITDIILYNDSTLIVAAGSIHLINLNTLKVSYITTADGLPSNTAVSVQRDARGNLWFGMTSGLCRANLERKIYTLYDRKDGIAYDNFEQLGGFQLNDGRLLFATPRNFIVFNSSIIATATPTPPMITAFRIGNEPLRIDSLFEAGKVVLRYDNSAISISFSNLNFLKQRKLRYYYKLDNLDNNWKMADATNQAMYNYIPPGRYTFYVRTVNEDGEMSSTTTYLNIEVKPPFWKTGLFYGLLGLALVVLLYIIDNERIKHVRTVQDVRTKIAVDLHKDIDSALTDIHLLSEMAKIKADKDITLSKDYIDRISIQSRNMKESMNEMLWSIDPDNDTMEKLLLRIQEYTDGFRQSQNVEIDLKTEKVVNRLVLDMRSRHELLLFYKEALNYTAQHLICSPILITIAYKRPRLSLKLLAQCNGIENQDLEAQQLKVQMQKRADALQALMDIFTDKNRIEVVLQLDIAQ